MRVSLDGDLTKGVKLIEMEKEVAALCEIHHPSIVRFVGAVLLRCWPSVLLQICATVLPGFLCICAPARRTASQTLHPFGKRVLPESRRSAPGFSLERASRRTASQFASSVHP